MIFTRKRPMADNTNIYKFPDKQHLALLFKQDSTPTLQQCFELLWITQHGSMHIHCPQCGLRSRFSFAGGISHAEANFQCEYSFCRYLYSFSFPLMNTRTKVTLQQWLRVVLVLLENKQGSVNKMAAAAGVSFITARDMRKRVAQTMGLAI